MTTAGVIGVKITGDSSALQKELDEAGRKVADFGGKVKEQASGIERLANGLKSAFVGSSVAVGLITLKNLMGDMVQGVVQAQIQVDRLRNGFNFAVGRDKAGSELAFIRQEAHELGLEFVGTSAQYMKLAAAARGTSMEGKQTRDIFNAIAQASVVMGLGAEESEGAFRAIVQMMSKGKVQAEELRGQLGERLPGAFNIAARAMGVTTGELDKMLEAGQVISTDFLPKFARQLSSEVAPEVEASSQSMQASVNRASNAWTALKQNVAESGVGAFVAGQMNVLADGMGGVSQSISRAREEGGGFAAQAIAAAGAALAFLNPLNAVSYSAQEQSNALKQARDELVRLKEEQSKYPGSPYFTGAIARTEDYIRALEKAIDKQKQLADGPRLNFRAADNATMAAYDAMATADRKQRDALMGSVSGQSERFQQRLAEAFALRQRGGFESDAQYTEFVRKLIEREGGVPKTKEPGFGPKDTAQRLVELRQAAGAVREEIQALQEKRKIEEELARLRLLAATGAVNQDYVSARRAQLQLQELDAQEQALRNQLAQAQAAERSAVREDDKVQALTKRLGIEQKLEELGIRRLQIDDGEAAFMEAIAKSEAAVMEERRKYLVERQRAGLQAGLDMGDEARQMRESLLPNNQQAAAILARESALKRAIVDVNYASAEDSRRAWEGYYDWFNERSAQLAREYIVNVDGGIQAYLRSISDAGRATAEASQRAAQNMEGGILDALKGSSAGLKRFVQQAVDDILTLRIVRPIMAELFGTGGGSALGGLGSSLINGLLGGGYRMDAMAAYQGPMTEAQLGSSFAAQFGQYAVPLASGMPYVPFDNFPALLHRGERVMTAEENASAGAPTVVQNITFNGGVSRSEVVAGMQQARQLAVADVIDGQARRRF